MNVIPWSRISRERLLTALILIVAYVLLAASSVTAHRYFPRSGNVQVTETNPIGLQFEHSVVKGTTEPAYEAVLFNGTASAAWSRFDVPIFDVDHIEVHAYYTPTQVPISVTLAVEFGPRVDKSVSVDTWEEVHTSLNTSSQALRDVTRELFATCRVAVYPDESITDVRVHVRGYSSRPLYPVTIDVLSTNEVKVLDNYYLDYMGFRHPYLRLDRDGNETDYGYAQLRRQNQTFYLSAGNYSGFFQWATDQHTYVRYPVNTTIDENEEVYWTIRVPVVEVEVRMNPRWPLVNLRVTSSYGYFDDIYDVYLDYSQPLIFLLPHGDSPVDITFTFIDPFFRTRLFASTTYYQTENILATSLEDIELDGTHNIVLDVNAPHLALMDLILRLQDILILGCSLTLLILVVSRIALQLDTGEKIPMRRDPRSIPVLILIGLALVPWFSTSRVLSEQGMRPQLIQTGLQFGPFPLFLSSTDGSSSTLLMPGFSLVWSVLPILLYWIPMTYAVVRLRTPSSFHDDVRLGTLLFLPLLLGLAQLLFANPEIYGTTPPVAVLPAFLVLLAVPVIWFIVIFVLRMSGKYTYHEPDRYIQSHLRLARDMEAIERLKVEENEEATARLPDRAQPWREFRPLDEDDVFKWICPLFFLVLILPSVISATYTLRFSYETMSWYTRFDGYHIFFVTALFGSEYYPYTRLAFILVTLPYTALFLLTLQDMTKMSNRSFDLRVTGVYLIGTYLSTIPGILILNWFGSLTTYSTITWFPLPLASIALTVVLIHLLRKAGLLTVGEPATQ
ncbi:hypothetical protein EU538_04850 [Candidatus Thorarchaeota archaeon]|nr:MAG: hypothetical protein EU538_04850 [Candidatus Thorarchaeota archaeon]